MGLGGVSIWQLLIILLIVVMIFGTKRLTSLGSDLGGAIKSFRRAMDHSDDDNKKKSAEDPKRIKSEEPDAEFAEEKDKSNHA
jgi:sec-independent protein translocase protein TatA